MNGERNRQTEVALLEMLLSWELWLRNSWEWLGPA